MVGEVKHAAALRTRGGRGDFAATVTDGTGTLSCYFFGQSFLARTLRPGVRVVVSGEWDAIDRRMSNPLFEVIEGDLEQLLHVGRLVPVHALTRASARADCARALRHALDAVADLVPDPVPARVSAARGYLSRWRRRCARFTFPMTRRRSRRRARRLVFEELFLLQMVMELRRRVLGRGGPRAGDSPAAARSRTACRRRCPSRSRTTSPPRSPTSRPTCAARAPCTGCVIGDVGSGKTVVALLAAAHVLEAGHQVAFMAPTEVLARQHATTLARLAAPLGRRGGGADRSDARPRSAGCSQARLAAGEPLLVVGTHALLEEKVQMPHAGAGDRGRAAPLRREAARRAGEERACCPTCWC